jgi:hypothetical protein
MQDNERLDNLSPAHRELEDALRGLSPASVSISRDRLMFQAGAMIGRRSANRWRGATALLVLVNVGLMALSVRSSREPVNSQIAQVPKVDVQSGEQQGANAELPESSWAASHITSQSSSAKSTEAYVSLRNDVLRRGLSALPVSSASLPAEQPITVDQLLGTSPRTREPESPWTPFAAPIRSFLFFGETL